MVGVISELQYNNLGLLNVHHRGHGLLEVQSRGDFTVRFETRRGTAFVVSVVYSKQ